MFKITDYFTSETCTLLMVVVVFAILFVELFDWSRFSLSSESCLQYGYMCFNGPLAWKEKFPKSKGMLQSPINITTKYAIVVPSETLRALRFSPEYYVRPKCVEICNDGHCVLLCAYFNGELPVMQGGPLNGSYRFLNLRFRWGHNDDSGSEHVIDAIQYSLEVQATHVRADCKFKRISEAVESNAIVITSHLYQVTPYDNPYLEAITTSLKNICTPLSQCTIDSIPLSWIIPPFTTQYFSYRGSLTYPPCAEGVHWLVQSEPLSISSKQMKQFRKLFSYDGDMTCNARPVQEVNCRDIFLYD